MIDGFDVLQFVFSFRRRAERHGWFYYTTIRWDENRSWKIDVSEANSTVNLFWINEWINWIKSASYCACLEKPQPLLPNPISLPYSNYPSLQINSKAKQATSNVSPNSPSFPNKSAYLASFFPSSLPSHYTSFLSTLLSVFNSSALTAYSIHLQSQLQAQSNKHTHSQCTNQRSPGPRVSKWYSSRDDCLCGLAARAACCFCCCSLWGQRRVGWDHLYKSLCLSVGLSVCLCVCRSVCL